MAMSDLHRLPRDGTLATADEPIVAQPVRSTPVPEVELTLLAIDASLDEMRDALIATRNGIDRLVAIEEERIAMERMLQEALQPQEPDVAALRESFFVKRDGSYGINLPDSRQRDATPEEAAIIASFMKRRER